MSKAAEWPLPRKANDSLVAPRQLLALFEANDLDVLIDIVFQVLQSAVRCDFASAFYHSAGAGLLKERDSLGREYGPDFMRRYIELTPALPAALANPGVKMLSTRVLMPMPEGALRKTAMYREVMRPQGWRHAVALCFWGNPVARTPVFVSSVYRRKGDKDFSKKDVARLERVHPFLDSALNRLSERESSVIERNAMAIAVRNDARGLAVLDRHLLTVHASPNACRWCAAWADGGSPGPADGGVPAWELPADLERGCRELHAEWQAMVRATPGEAVGLRSQRRLPCPRMAGLSATITMVCPHNDGLGEPTFVIEFDKQVYGVALEALDQAAPLLQELTVAERAVAVVLADGRSNQEIADELGKTVAGVKFLLHRIFQKTGLPNRSALVAALRSGSAARRKLP